jgi:signal transduction histidine kinase
MLGWIHKGQKMIVDDAREDLMGKYRLAGKIRLISFCLLLLFLLLMKWMGGYSYLNAALLSLILVEAILNQPYDFIVRRVNIHRLQYYQMATDIIAISWLMYYMGGIDAPVVIIAYYAIILWAGVASTVHAVFFAVIASTLSFSAIVLLEHGGMLSQISLYNDRVPTARMLSLLAGNISYLFAFGYFSAYSSKVIKFLERKQQNESLRHAHKFEAIDHIISATTHDILGCFTNVKACATILLDGEDLSPDEKKDMLNIIVEDGSKGVVVLRRLSMFSRKRKTEFEKSDINEIIDEAINLTWPVVRYSKLTIERDFRVDMPMIDVIKDQIQEVFVAMILNALDATVKRSMLTIKTSCDEEKGRVVIILSDTGVGMKQEYLNQIEKPFLTNKEYRESLGTGLAISDEIISRHKGVMLFKNAIGGGGATFTINLPVVQKGLLKTLKSETKENMK